ncbi:hypothetical protein RDV64_04755 [Acuticoccus sp. MNP-M23]|uniref:AbiTii domain-containing protein n=1 Tax=Acuticoccus sp. MNP-M23 TaxID=3072793 RepID=UPI002814F871|nr:hypothetical protein [Acuticoccus sp. MNP-M23]WMS43715.1 hypothetical protein RDV64_04755 [Acuticoccus sp. MNP-M23]
MLPEHPSSSLVHVLSELAVAADAAGHMDVVDWARSELGGYRSDVPAYRHVHGVPMGFNPMRGWIPVYLEDRNLLKRIGGHTLRQSIGNIEQAVANSRNGKAYVHYTAEQIAFINAAGTIRYAQMASNIDVASLASVVDSVRSLAASWQKKLGTLQVPVAPEHQSAAH